jgi:hypothetical protein
MWFLIVWLDLKKLVDLKFRAINLDSVVMSEKKTMAQVDLIYANPRCKLWNIKFKFLRLGVDFDFVNSTSCFSTRQINFVTNFCRLN